MTMAQGIFITTTDGTYTNGLHDTITLDQLQP